MKAYIPIYILILALLLSACSSQTEMSLPTVDTSSGQPEIAVSTEKSDVEKQIEFLAANYELWKAENESDWWGYAITDLDQNGRLEVVTSEDHGTGHYKTTSIWEVTSSFDNLVVCGQGRSCDVDVLEYLATYGGPQPCGPLITPLLYSSNEPQTYSVYYDSKADFYHYIFRDSINYKGEWYGTFAVQRSFSLQNDEVNGILLSYEKNVYNGWQDCWDILGNYVSHEMCQMAANDFYSNMVLLEAEILWINDRHLGETDESEIFELLKNSIDSFSIGDLK